MLSFAQNLTMSFTFWILILSVVAGIILIELYFAKKKGLKIYTMSDTLVNLSCGILERLFDFFWAVMLYLLFWWLFDNFTLWHIPSNPLTWFIGLLVADFLAYWHHRLSHEINVLWAAHIVHHQSEELNVTTVFRVSLFAVINRSFFFIWMPIMGFHPDLAISTFIFVGAFQFVTHSRVVGKLGILDKIFSTPSNHRVHHARNEKYIDHNYAHVFIIWDKIFNTYMPEEEEPLYGITTGFESTNAYSAQMFYWKDLFTRARRTEKFMDKVRLFVKKPAWTPAEVGYLPPQFKTDENGNRLHHQRPVSTKFGVYMLANNVATFGLFLWLVLHKRGMGADITVKGLLTDPAVLGIAAIILFAVYAHGRMLDNKPFAKIFDSIRLLAMAAILPILFQGAEFTTWFNPILWLYCGGMMIWLWTMSAETVEQRVGDTALT
ncbi:MAG: alkylglycerol monooxygenase [Bacteroidia bacterium]